MIPQTCVLLADGTEEMEAVIIIDVLRRADWPVTVAGLNVNPVTASRGVILTPDCSIDDVDFDEMQLLLIPGGGPGVAKLRADQRVIDSVNSFHHHGKWIGCICAAPLILQEAGEFTSRTITCHPSVRDELADEFQLSDERVVTDGSLVTSQGPGTTFEFALTLVSILDSAEKAKSLADAMVLPKSLQALLQL